VPGIVVSVGEQNVGATDIQASMFQIKYPLEGWINKNESGYGPQYAPVVSIGPLGVRLHVGNIEGLGAPRVDDIDPHVAEEWGSSRVCCLSVLFCCKINKQGNRRHKYELRSSQTQHMSAKATNGQGFQEHENGGEPRSRQNGMRCTANGGKLVRSPLIAIIR
jgi:hypothetical protein